MDPLTKPVWRWDLRKGDVIANERWLNWFRPYIFLKLYEDLVRQTMILRSDEIVKTINDSNALLGVLKNRNNRANPLYSKAKPHQHKE